MLNFGIFRSSLGHFYILIGFSRHFMCIFQILTTSTCCNAPKLVEKSHVSLGEFLGPMQEMGMKFKHHGTVDCRQNVEMPGF